MSRGAPERFGTLPLRDRNLEDRKLKEIEHSKNRRTILKGYERHIDIDFENVQVSKYNSLPHQIDEWFKSFHKAIEMCGPSSNERRIISKNETKYFEYYKVVLIGKSMLKKFERDGGQNPIDAAKLGCKIFHGPYVSNFNEVYDLLKSYNISEQINNYEDRR